MSEDIDLSVDEKEEEGLDGLNVNFEDYQVSTSPNDFNISSLVDFIDKGILIIPGFQRNYVWDKKRASKLIESLTLNLPVPQLFLYEVDSKFYVIDGQQRLMTIYYFKKGRFPDKDKRSQIRNEYRKNNNKLSESILANNELFSDFRLSLPKSESGNKNKLNGLSYSSFGEYQTKFEFKTIRTITIKQNFPEDDDSSMYEIFNRLNTGGVHLKPQEIRMSMYSSKFYQQLEEINENDIWRKLLNQKNVDTHMKDIEILLRGIAMLTNLNEYAPSMVAFLNKISKKMKKSKDDELDLIFNITKSFLNKNSNLDFFKSNRFNISLFESIFVACCSIAWRDKDPDQVVSFPEDRVSNLKNDTEYIKLITSDTTGVNQVKERIRLANEQIKN